MFPSRKCHIRNRIQFLIAPRRFDGRCAHVDAFDVLAIVGDRQREAALIAEAIEHFARCISPRRPVILALVEERAGLLPFARSKTKVMPFSFARISAGTSPCKHADALLEPFEQPHLGIVALQNSLRREKLDQDFDEQRLSAVPVAWLRVCITR